MIRRCLYCYLPLRSDESDFHEKCSLRFFGTARQPDLDLSKESMEDIARQIVARSVAVTGVQPKLSLSLQKTRGDHKNARLTIVGALGGDFILKPQSDMHASLPENEDLTMHLAGLLDIRTSDHSLIRLRSGELAYITRRFDRKNGGKLACEDLCQLTEELTEYKYRGSMERVGKKIREYSDFPMLDVLHFFELSLFSFITGNADMHLKNFSILRDELNHYSLAPAYDLLATKLAVPEDMEEMALTVNGKKNRLRKVDFDTFGKTIGLNQKQMDTIYSRFGSSKEKMNTLIDCCFLPEKLREEYVSLVEERLKRLVT